ncbi:MAG: electron transport complex subunit RsxG [Xanthomonadales bacterium]|nr:electron transport complex subunit RsxG [Xanthomonadales bacterium]|tara:strand:- start:516 stop:1160 length:645 start_codon:yes stop_codon:yes gene_type:complete
MLKTLLTLGLIGLLAAALLSGVHLATRDRIASEQQRQALATLNQLVPESEYDNALVEDWFNAWISGLSAPSTIYRARMDGEPVALLADVITPDGYSGDIRLLVGLTPQGEVIGVRVLEHRETPGLGDQIELKRSDWIRQFDGKSLAQPPAQSWAADRRGGAFDTLSSATITSSAVIEAVGNVLAWYAANRENAFEIRTESKDSSTSETRDGNNP